MNRGGLIEHFGISAQQASADLARYLELAPENLAYDKNLKTYRATAAFKPAVASYEAQFFLDQLAALSAGTLPPTASFVGWQPAHDLVRFPVRPIKTESLLRLLWAIRDRNELRVLYQSMRRPEPTSRWIAPHALGYDGLRWHIRAWCHENGDFRDFVISRVQKIQASRTSDVSPEADTWWHTFVEVQLRPRAGLTLAQRRAVELDYGMIEGSLKLRCRKALVFYLLRQLQLERPNDLPPAVQPLELMNRKELSEITAVAAKSPTDVIR